MTTAVKQQGPKKTLDRADKPVVERADMAAGPINEDSSAVRPGVQPAYRAYLQARKGLANAFRGRERQDKAAYEGAAARYQAYEEAIDRALAERERTERDALDVFRKTVDGAVQAASQSYRESLKLAVRECRQSTEQAWRASMETSAGMTSVFLKDDGVQDSHGQPGMSPRSVRIFGAVRGKLLAWKSSCASLIRRTLRAHGQPAGGIAGQQ